MGDEGFCWDPNDLPDLGRQVVSGASGFPSRGEYMLYYGKLPGFYFNCGGEDGGSCNIPLYSVENSPGESEFNVSRVPV